MGTKYYPKTCLRVFSLTLAVGLSLLPLNHPSAQTLPQNSGVIGNNQAGEVNQINIMPPKTYQPRLRTGIDAQKVLRLSLNDAITMMLSNNLEAQIEKNNIKSMESSLLAALGVYDPLFKAQFNYSQTITPTVSALQGDPRAAQDEIYTYNFNLAKDIANGANFKAEFNNTYISTNNRFFVLSPVFIPQISVTYRQPLFKNFRINQPQRDIQALKRKLDITDLVFRKKLIDLVARTQAAYYDLAYALENERILRDSVNQAGEQITRNIVEVAAGRLAPIEVTVAEAEFERRKETAISELYAITQNENALKNLILGDPLSELWSYQITPTNGIEFLPEQFQLDNSIEIALQQRPEIKELELQNKINKVDIKFLKNQQKPQVDVFATFSSQGIGGSLGASNFFNSKIQPDFVGSYGTALSNIFGFRNYIFGATVSLPLGNHAAKANLTNAKITANQIDTQKKQIIQHIVTEVRNAMQNLDVTIQRVEASQAAVKASVKQLDAEQVRFKVGLSTNFLVLERQNNLATARSRELRAITDCIKARAELMKAMASNLP